MKTFIAILSATLALAAVAGAQSISQNKGSNTAMLKAVIHVNFADTERHDHALGNIENILKEVPAATVEVVCHGSGISLVLKKDAKLAEKVAALMKQGVHFVACENTMKKKELSKDELVAGVSTVPSGAVEVLRKQQDGYGYFKP